MSQGLTGLLHLLSFITQGIVARQAWAGGYLRTRLLVSQAFQRVEGRDPGSLISGGQAPQLLLALPTDCKFASFTMLGSAVALGFTLRPSGSQALGD